MCSYSSTHTSKHMYISLEGPGFQVLFQLHMACILALYVDMVCIYGEGQGSK